MAQATSGEKPITIDGQKYKVRTQIVYQDGLGVPGTLSTTAPIRYVVQYLPGPTLLNPIPDWINLGERDNTSQSNWIFTPVAGEGFKKALVENGPNSLTTSLDDATSNALSKSSGVTKQQADQILQVAPNVAPPTNPTPTNPTPPGPTPTDPVGTATTITAGTGFKSVDLGTYESDKKGPPLYYPLNRKERGNYDYLAIDTYKYVAGGLIGGINSASSKIKDVVGSSIYLPMQSGIQDSNSVSWGEDPLNPFQAGLAGIAADTIDKIGDLDVRGTARAFFGGLGDQVRRWAQDPNMSGYVSAYFAGQAVGANVIGRQTGVVLNNNLELLFDGPTLRTFNYNYTFTPRDGEEAKVVKQIILHFKRHMAVKRSVTKMFLGTPNVFQLKYLFNGTEHPFLNKIKLCALTDLSVDYTPSGSYMTYGDGSMTSYSVKLTFKELDPIYRDDQEEAGGMGY